MTEENPGRGGYRPGAGRKPELGSRKAQSTLGFRATNEQKESIRQHVAAINEDRKANGEDPISISTWLRETVMRTIDDQG